MIGAGYDFWLRAREGNKECTRATRNFPLRPKKTLSHRLAYIATSAHVSDANDFAQFVRTKNHAKEISAGRERTLLTCFVVLTG